VPLEDEVILMHVGAAAAGDYEALPLLVDYYRQQGHAFVTVEQMLQP
jgi:peptidoglycan/xylan/chitin deacetylase (PgdA/CDA1 family)